MSLCFVSPLYPGRSTHMQRAPHEPKYMASFSINSKQLFAIVAA